MAKRAGRTAVLVWVQALVLLSCAPPAFTHEIRPAYLQIDETDDHGFDILWKQPTTGEVALHLVPHLSSGWLDGKPSVVQPTASFVIMRWRIPGGVKPALEGQTVFIEGLQDTITDALVVVHAGSTSWQTILTPAQPSQQLDLNQAHPPGALPVFLRLGVEHILTGVDHLLFVLGLILIVTDRWALLKTITAFTVAHSITLALATLGFVHAPIALIDAEIALSILFLAPEALRRGQGKTSFTLRRPWVIAFVFGLLHGFGFAGGLSEAGLPPHNIPLALLLFNLGVEMGQLAFVGVVLGLLQLLRASSFRVPRPIELLPAYILGTAGAFWTIQRIALLVTAYA